MNNQQSLPAGGPRCPFCPAGCPVQAVEAGPDLWRAEPPPVSRRGLCPRGAGLLDLSLHPRRFREPTCGGRTTDLRSAAEAVLEAAAGRPLTLFVDGAFTACEQLASIAAWCRGWDRMRLCFVTEPADAQLLLGLETCGAPYLTAADLEAADGFLLIGDVFGANPTTARAVFEARARNPRVPVAVIDPGGGPAVKFATHRIPARPGRELGALAALAHAAGVRTKPSFQAVAAWEDVEQGGDHDLAFCTGPSPESPTARGCAEALKACRQPAVVIAPDHGRTRAWRAIGYLAGRLAASLGGGVSAQTVGDNALASVRLGAVYDALSLADALAGTETGWVTVGVDLLGLLGWTETPAPILAAAAALPDRTTAAVEVVLPLALPWEIDGSHFVEGDHAAWVGRLAPPPAGVSAPVEAVAALARAAGASRATSLPEWAEARRLSPPAPAVPEAPDPVTEPALVLTRDPAQAGSGALTGHAAWSTAAAHGLEVRMAPARARTEGVGARDEVELHVGDRTMSGRVRIDPELDSPVVALADGHAATRQLMPCRVDAVSGEIFAAPRSVDVRRLPRGGSR